MSNIGISTTYFSEVNNQEMNSSITVKTFDVGGTVLTECTYQHLIWENHYFVHKSFLSLPGGLAVVEL